MFAWYVRGAPKVYEPPLSHAVPAVTATRALHSVQSSELSATATDTHPSTIKGYGEGNDPATPQRRQVLLIKEIMSTPVHCVHPDDPIEKVSHLFSSKKVRHAPVCDARRKLCGIASERDLLRKLVSNRPDPLDDSSIITARDFMKHSVLTAQPEAEIRYAARVMFQERIGSLPIVDKSGILVGIVTRSDILRTLMNIVPLELWT